MLLSFCIPSMLPMLRAGLAQRAGVESGWSDRVKRQTMRRYGPRAAQMLACDSQGHTLPYELHLWWKSRTQERAPIGVVTPQADKPVRVYRIGIAHDIIKPIGKPEYQCIRIDGPRGWRDGDPVLNWSPDNGGDDFEREARADGFDSAEDFRDFFVPNLGDRFDAILFKW